jgi:mRNA-degrading endonuclease toxin of MazEF toxin-antitoxin module
MAIRRGEIYFVNLNPVTGREQAGQRPVLVLSVDEINRQPLVVTVVVGTSGGNVTRDYAVNVRVPAEKSGLPIETESGRQGGDNPHILFVFHSLLMQVFRRRPALRRKRLLFSNRSSRA